MAKTIVVCCDGTWNEPDQTDRGKYRPSNVVKLARSVAPENGQGEAQVVFYDTGVGTGGWLDKLLGGATGDGLSKNVKDAYTFLINNYNPGDKVFAFGFSRGAYTARSFGGLVGKMGLLKRKHWPLYHKAYQLYRDENLTADSPIVEEFRKNYCQPCQIYFMGVWDTVGSLGIPISWLNWFWAAKYKFHDVGLSPVIPYAYHAMAIDEKRKAFAPAIWKKAKSSRNKEVQQVWFAGVHCNIGGGFADTGLADISFTWMRDKAKGAGLEFNKEMDEMIHPKYKGELRESYQGFYKLLGKHIRPIGNRDSAGESVISEEQIHQSALLRRDDQKTGYSPTNLPPGREENIPVVSYDPSKEEEPEK